jgi:hypothetical protein
MNWDLNLTYDHFLGKQLKIIYESCDDKKEQYLASSFICESIQVK